MILVSGFSGPISDFSPLSPYITKSKVDTNYFRGIKKKLVYLSDNDDLNRTGFVGDFLFKLGHLT